jgi:phospholipid transport system transporter-binding protein
MQTDESPKPVAQSADADAAVAALRGDLTIYRAAEVRDELLGHLAGAVRRFDLAGITECDSAGLQLLVAAAASVAQAGGRAQFLAPAPCVRETFALCGLHAWLAAAAKGDVT